MINPGTYRARAMGSAPPYVQFGIANTGTEQVAVTFMIYQERYDDRGGSTGEYEPTGEEVVWIGSFTERTIERTCESLRIAGWTTNDLDDLAGLGSTDVDLVIEHEEYEGKTRVRVRWVNKPGSGGFKFKEAMPPANFADLKRRVKAVAIASQQGSGGARRPAAQAQTQRASGGHSAAGRAPHRHSAGDWDGQGADPNGSDSADDLPF